MTSLELNQIFAHLALNPRSLQFLLLRMRFFPQRSFYPLHHTTLMNVFDTAQTSAWLDHSVVIF